MEQPNETTALLARADSLGGPRLSGEVKVSLAEIDQLRADYVNAVRAYKELALHTKEVRVVLVDGDGTNNKLVKDKSKRESISYKNLDEVRTLIAQEERESLKNQFNTLNTQLELSRAETFKAIELQNDLKTEMQQMAKRAREEEKKLSAQIKEKNLLIDETLSKNKELLDVLEQSTRDGNICVSNLEKLHSEFNDLSQKYVVLQEEKRPWWRFW